MQKIKNKTKEKLDIRDKDKVIKLSLKIKNKTFQIEKYIRLPVCMQNFLILRFRHTKWRQEILQVILILNKISNVIKFKCKRLVNKNNISKKRPYKRAY